MSSEQPEQPWHAAYPSPRSTPSSLPREELLQWFQQDKKDFMLVDLRREDFQGGTIQRSLNLPAQSLHPSIDSVYTALKNRGVQVVVWYCGSSRGRGTRAAGWFQDYIEEQQDPTMKSLILEGGIKGWVAAGQEYTDLMVDYDASHWTEKKD